jgi:creatinine amidohydrolase
LYATFAAHDLFMKAAPMKEWIHLTSDEINQLDSNLPVIIPLGLVESHGPHLAVVKTKI